MKKRFRPRLFREPKPEVTWENGMITLRGETLRKVTAMAQEQGLSVPEYINKRLRELLTDPVKCEEMMARAAAARRRRFAL